MDLATLLNEVTNIDDYRAITQDLETKYKSQNVGFNMSSVLCLIKLRSHEIEYFTKCHENGAAFLIFERILRYPPSKTWGDLLGKKLTELLQFWLDAVRCHLINRHIHGWSFLRQLLGFVQKLSTKDEVGNKMGNILTSLLSESLLCLSTHSKTSPEQAHVIVTTLNECCSNSSREVRQSLKAKLDTYFTKLAHMLATCGHFPTQYSGMETLLRYLIPRQDETLRSAMLNVWFPPTLYTPTATQIFKERQWMDFFKDMKYPSYVDFNRGSKSLTVLLSSVSQDRPNVCDWITVACDNVQYVALLRDQKDRELTISITTHSAPGLYPTSNEIFRGSKSVKIKVNFTDLDYVSQALEIIFGDKYKYNPDIPRYSQDKRRFNSGIAETIKDSPLESTKESLSSVSTTSLAQLPEKLASLAPFPFDSRVVKKPIVAAPELSCVTEASETDDIPNSFESTSTLKIRPLQSGACSYLYKRYKVGIETEGKVQSDDSDMAKRPTTDEKDRSLSDSDTWKKPNSGKHKCKSISSLLAVTMQAAAKEFLETSMERLPQDQDTTTDSLTEMLVQEALRARNCEERVDYSEINTADQESQDRQDDSVVENTPNEDLGSVMKAKEDIAPTDTNSKVTSKSNSIKASTSDESNTSVINDTPMANVNVKRGNFRQNETSPSPYVTVRRGNLLMHQPKIRRQSLGENRSVVDERDDHDAAAVDEFFLQNKGDGPSISPSHARRINESNSDTDDGLEANLNSNLNVNVEQFNREVDVMDCVTNLLENVAEEVSPKAAETEKTKDENNEPLVSITNTQNPETKPTKSNKKKYVKKPAKKIGKLNEKYAKTAKANKNKLELAPAKKSPIKTRGEASAPNKKCECDTPALVRRKRKLYSPKDDANLDCDKNEDQENKKPSKALQKSKSETDETDSEDEQPLIELKEKQTTKSKVPKSRASCYMDIEKDRKIFRSRSHNRKSRCPDEDPKSKQQNDLFDSLKNNIEGTEKVVLVDKRSESIYNFTGESSDDEDFKRKKEELKKRVSVTPASTNLTSAPGQRKGVKPPTQRRRKTKIDRTLDDEKMRAKATEELNTSFVVEKDRGEGNKDLEPNIIAPQIVDDEHNLIPKSVLKAEGKKPAVKKDVIKTDKIERAKTLKPDTKRPRKEQAKPESNKAKLNVNKGDNDDSNSSPLPALEIETENKQNQEANESLVSSNLAKKIKIMYQNNEDVDDVNNTQNLLGDTDRNSPLDPLLCFPEKVNRKTVYKNKVVCGTTLTGIQVKMKGYSDISDAEKEHDRPDSQKTADNSGSAMKKKKLQLKKKIGLKTAAVALTREDISAATKVSRDGKQSKSVSPTIEVINIDDGAERPKKSLNGTDSKVVDESADNLIEEIDLVSDSEEQSGKCISSVGITGHGDSTEAPPNSNEFNEQFVPRNVQDLAPNMIELVETYGKIITESPKSARTARIVLERLTPDNIERLSRSSVTGNDCDDEKPLSTYMSSRQDSQTSRSGTTENKKETKIVHSKLAKTSQVKNTFKAQVQSQIINTTSEPQKTPVVDSKTPKSGQTKAISKNKGNVKPKARISPMVSLRSFVEKRNKQTFENKTRNSSSQNDTVSEICQIMKTATKRKDICNELVTEKTKKNFGATEFITQLGLSGEITVTSNKIHDLTLSDSEEYDQPEKISAEKSTETAKNYINVPDFDCTASGTEECDQPAKTSAENSKTTAENNVNPTDVDLTISDNEESDQATNTSTVTNVFKKTAKNNVYPSSSTFKIGETVFNKLDEDQVSSFGEPDVSIINRVTLKNTAENNTKAQKTAAQIERISSPADGTLSETSKKIIDKLLKKCRSPNSNDPGQTPSPNSNLLDKSRKMKDSHGPIKRLTPMQKVEPKRLKLDQQNPRAAGVSLVHFEEPKQHNVATQRQECSHTSTMRVSPNAESKRPKVGQRDKPTMLVAASSTASVHSWLLDSQEKEKERTEGNYLEDIAKVFLEKLETTLTESHRETRQSILQLLMDYQKKLSDYKAEHRQEIENVLKRHETKVEDLMTSLNLNTMEKLRADWKKDQNALSLLKDEIHSILNQAKAHL